MLSCVEKTMKPTPTKTNRRLAMLLCAFSLGFGHAAQAAGTAPRLPDPALDEPVKSRNATRSVVLAGGCFWGIEAVFQQVKGVQNAVSGYAGGSEQQASYPLVSSGATGHAEAVQITYDPAQVTLGTLLKVFFSVAHDPTTLDRQGPDHGPQYRSAIFYADATQEDIARRYIAQLDTAKAFASPIVTKLEPLSAFYPAEAYHQDFVQKNPNNPYILAHDLPKLTQLQQVFPALYKP